MKALLQRVKTANVRVDGSEIARIGKGLLIFLGVGCDDTEANIAPLVSKIANLRIFEDESGKINLSLQDVSGEALVVSQFTLYADCRKGRRPSFILAAPPDRAEALYEKFVEACRAASMRVSAGQFQAMMEVSLTNDGPFTILLE